MELRWVESLYGTGNEEIDTEHRQLFAQMNRLFRACMQGSGADEIRPIAEFLGRYVRDHFAHEERVMAAQSCPVAEANKAAHRRFLTRYQSLCDELERISALPVEERSARYAGAAGRLQTDLCKWFSEHIVAIDTKLRQAAP